MYRVEASLAMNMIVSAEKEQLIWLVAKSAGDDLSTTENAQFYDLLLSYAEIFAGNDKDIGHTS